jgi:hypothetical protein
VKPSPQSTDDSRPDCEIRKGLQSQLSRNIGEHFLDSYVGTDEPTRSRKNYFICPVGQIRLAQLLVVSCTNPERSTGKLQQP